MDPDLLTRLEQLAHSSPEPIGALSMDEIAARLGMTRMTLYRKGGSRQAIIEALARAGIDARGEPLVRERVVDAVATLLADRPLADITLEAIAVEARCSVPAIYNQLGGRQGVLRAAFERYSPLLTVERLAHAELTATPPDLERDARALYGAIFDAVGDRWPVLRAFVAEVLRDPESEVGRLFRDWYVPRATEALAPVLARHQAAGSFRPLPPALIAQAFVGPFMLHIATRQALAGVSPDLVPDRETTIATFAGIFCRAVGAEPDPGSVPPVSHRSET